MEPNWSSLTARQTMSIMANLFAAIERVCGGFWKFSETRTEAGWCKCLCTSLRLQSRLHLHEAWGPQVESEPPELHSLKSVPLWCRRMHQDTIVVSLDSPIGRWQCSRSALIDAAGFATLHLLTAAKSAPPWCLRRWSHWMASERRDAFPRWSMVIQTEHEAYRCFHTWGLACSI